jgi:hypothetical protein
LHGLLEKRFAEGGIARRAPALSGENFWSVTCSVLAATDLSETHE